MDVLRSLIPGLEQPRPDGYTTLIEGRVLLAPANETQGLHFTIPAFDGEVHEWGPAPWPTRVYTYTHPHADGLTCRILLPAVGDRVLVGFTSGRNDDPWVIDWWPTSGYQETRV